MKFMLNVKNRSRNFTTSPPPPPSLGTLPTPPMMEIHLQRNKRIHPEMSLNFKRRTERDAFVEMVWISYTAGSGVPRWRITMRYGFIITSNFMQNSLQHQKKSFKSNFLLFRKYTENIHTEYNSFHSLYFLFSLPLSLSVPVPASCWWRIRTWEVKGSRPPQFISVYNFTMKCGTTYTYIRKL